MARCVTKESGYSLRVLIFFLWSWFSDSAAIHHSQRVIDAINV